MSEGAAAPRAPRALGRLHALTSLRFFAAIVVVLHHTCGLYLPTHPGPLAFNEAIEAGFLGVDFFFPLSGFILAVNYLGPPDAHAIGPLDQRAPAGDRRRAVRAFLVARIARIHPVFLLSLVIIAPFIVAQRLHADGLTAGALGKLASSLGGSVVGLQAWVAALSVSWNYPSWTLSVELFFYLTFPWVGPRLWCSKHGDLTLLLALYAAALGLPALANAFADTAPLRLLGGAFYLTVLRPLRLAEFMFGIVLARLHLRVVRRPGGAGALARFPSLLWVPGLLGLGAVVALRHRLPDVIVHDGVIVPFAGS
jgi:peptidoglycan/LPS O-acetylase OafA/YrhL